MIRSRLAGLLCLAAMASLSACGPSGEVASAGSLPAAGAPAAPIESVAPVAAAIADATLPPPAAISPTAKTTIDDAAITVAWDALDTAAYAADALLALKPDIAGTPAAKRLANALEGTSSWLTIASQAQRASQAQNYVTALSQAKAALAGARDALAELRRN